MPCSRRGFFCCLEAVQNSNYPKRRTSGAKALIGPAYFGTAEAVPFVERPFPIGEGKGRTEKKKPQISPLRCAPVEMTNLWQGEIPRFQERSAELQIGRLPRISCRELRLRSTAGGSL
jgi:hypothetical protein